MLTLRDHNSAAPPDFWIQLGVKRKQLLDHSWAGVFREYLLSELPVGELAPHFSKNFGRPSKDLHVVLGALVLQQRHDLTDLPVPTADRCTDRGSHGIQHSLAVCLPVRVARTQTGP